MNHLQYELSPYLLQHAHNPVDWNAWKPEALERAKAENKPILVSIGYSTCHWCHVMERESFENEDIAAFMNENFINIKVDREERPDVDAIYMEACQILTGSGGWPLNCFLTPDGRPFYAGTYFPPRPAHNRPSWLQVLTHMANLWENEREKVLDQADKLTKNVARNDSILSAAPAGEEGFTPGLLENIFYQMRERFDRVDGGFGSAPKFPGTMAIVYLLRYHHHTNNAEALEQALLSLDKMIHGGIYDQIGGGFARYSTDTEWLAPHFEKMLYDNALLVVALSEAYKTCITLPEFSEQAGRYRETIEETLAFVEREMTHPDGAFYSAQDADTEGVEGKFYVWDDVEVREILAEDADLFCDFYDVTPHGNWEEKSILRRLKSYEEYATEHKLDLQAMKSQLSVSRERLFAERKKRSAPGLDDKVLLDWNALMVSAYAEAYTALGHEKYRDTAERAMTFLLKNFDRGGLGLFHTWKNGQAQYDAFLDDHAFLIAALIDLWQITFKPNYLGLAGKYTEQVLSYFYDAEAGLFFFTDARQRELVLRKKDLYDNATPSGNSTMAHNLQRLAVLLDKPEWHETAERMLKSLRDAVERYPLSFERWAAALQNEVYGWHEIAVVGGNAFEKAAMLSRLPLSNKVLVATTSESELPLLAGKTGGADAMIYLCRDYTCKRPVQTVEAFLDLLND